MLYPFCRPLLRLSRLGLSESAAFAGKTARAPFPLAPQELTPAPQVPSSPSAPVTSSPPALCWCLVLEDPWPPTDTREVHVPEAEPGQLPTYRAEVPPRSDSSSRTGQASSCGLERQSVSRHAKSRQLAEQQGEFGRRAVSSSSSSSRCSPARRKACFAER